MMLGLLVGCAARTPGGEPHDMGSAAHEAEARREEQVAAGHEGEYDPRAEVSRVQCGTAGYGRQVCWTSAVNPTEAHLREAERHRRMAADHRAASEALRAAEASACASLAPEDRDTSPFEHREDLVAVAPIVADRPDARGWEAIAGAVVTVRAVPGLTTEWLQEIVDCHLARNAALGHDVPEMPDCPLVPSGATATVSEGRTGFDVTIRSDDPVAGAEILERARRLLAGQAEAGP
ncbi:MAG: hypothetical protein ACOZNI_13885 [Myxococcota bacterium]